MSKASVALCHLTNTNMKSFACVVLLAATALAAPGAPGQRDKRGYLSGWSSLDHGPSYSLDYAHGYHGISDYSLHEPIHSLSYVAPAHKIVSYEKVVHEPKVVAVKKIVSFPKLVSVPRVVSVSKIVEEPHHVSYSSIGSHSSISHGWW